MSDAIGADSLRDQAHKNMSSAQPLPPPPPAPPSGPPTKRASGAAYARMLLTARWLYLPVLLVIGSLFLFSFVSVLAGARHASGTSVGLAAGGMLLVALLLAGLPLLLFVADQGEGTRSRSQHLIGGLSLLVSLVVGVSQLWTAIGMPALQRWRAERALQNLSISAAKADPIRVGDVIVGARLHVDLALANDVALDAVGRPVLDAMGSLRLASATDAPLAASAFAVGTKYGQVTRGGEPVIGATLIRGSYQYDQTILFAGMRWMDGQDAPCKVVADVDTPFIHDALRQVDGKRWLMKTSVPPPASFSSGFRRPDKVFWQAASAPLEFDGPGAAWPATLAALPVMTCDAQRAATEATRQQKQLEDFRAGKLPASETQRLVGELLCADDAARVKALATLELPNVPLYAVATRCAREKQRPEILSALGTRLVAHADDEKLHCQQLIGAHSAHDAERLRQFAASGLPVDCNARPGRAWHRGLEKTAPPKPIPGAEIEREVQWIRALIATKVPVCEFDQKFSFVLQHAVLKSSAEALNAWLDAGCDPAARTHPDVIAQKDPSNYSARLLWQLRVHRRASDPFKLPISTDPVVNADIDKRMGLPDAKELNTPFPQRGGVVFLHDYAFEVLAAPQLLRLLVDRGARLDAAASEFKEALDSPRQNLSWFAPGYHPLNQTNIDVQAALNVLSHAEMRKLLTPVVLTTGQPGARMTLLDDDHNTFNLRAYLCGRKLRACPNR